MSFRLQSEMQVWLAGRFSGGDLPERSSYRHVYRTITAHTCELNGSKYSWPKKHGFQSGCLRESRTTTRPAAGIHRLIQSCSDPSREKVTVSAQSQLESFRDEGSCSRSGSQMQVKRCPDRKVEDWPQSVLYPGYLVRKCQGALSVDLIGNLTDTLSASMSC